MMAKLEVFSIKQVGTIQRVINMGMGQKWSKYQSHDTAFCSCSVLTVEFFKCTQLLTHTLLTGRRFDFFFKEKNNQFLCSILLVLIDVLIFFRGTDSDTPRVGWWKRKKPENTSIYMFVCKNHGFLMFPVDIPFKQSIEAANSPVSPRPGKVTGWQDCFDGGCGEKAHGTGRHAVEPCNEKSQICQLAKGPQKHGLHC